MSKILQVCFTKKDKDYQKYVSLTAGAWGRTVSQAEVTNERNVILALPCSSQTSFFD